MNELYNSLHYKSMNWYEILGFDNNEENKKWRRGEYWSTEEIEKNYHNCLSLLNRGILSEINSFYKKQLPNGKIENLSELREKMQLAYNTLINPEKRKEYDLEVRGIFHYTYPADEIADEKFRIKAIASLEYFLHNEWDEKNSYWKNHLSDYWQNWRGIMKELKQKEEIKFLISRFHELRMFILKCTGWGKPENLHANALGLIKQEQKRLQNISKEEWDKEQERNKMSEEDFEWVAENVKKVLNGENDKKITSPSDNSPKTNSTLDKQNSNFPLVTTMLILSLLLVGSISLFLAKKNKIK